MPGDGARVAGAGVCREVGGGGVEREKSSEGAVVGGVEGPLHTQATLALTLRRGLGGAGSHGYADSGWSVGWGESWEEPWGELRGRCRNAQEKYEWLRQGGTGARCELLQSHSTGEQTEGLAKATQLRKEAEPGLTLESLPSFTREKGYSCPC